MEITLLLLAVTGATLLAWINGANNAGNAIGSAIGSKAISIRKALWLAFLFELLGGLLLGHFVSLTLLKGMFNINEINDREVALIGLNIALFSTVSWVFIATILKVPMSISQAIVGGMIGFGLATLGFEKINWVKVMEIFASWIYLPFLSMLITLILYKTVAKLLHNVTWVKLVSLFTLLCFINVFAVFTLLLIKTVKTREVVQSIALSSVLSALVSLIPLTALRKVKFANIDEAKEKSFRILLLISCLSMAFSHGANDVANSAGPLAGALYIGREGSVPEGASIPLSVLALSAVAMAIGVLMWGYRVAETIGEKITTLSVETGFIAQFSASITVLIVTRLGLPVSTTVAVVGSIAGVGLARGAHYVNFKTLFKIILMWFIGFPSILALSFIGVKLALLFI